MAMGAERRKILKMVVWEGLLVALLGIALGAFGTLPAGRAISTYLYGVSPSDPLSYLLMGIGLMAVALLACLLPARRATKVDPMVALRYE
jgi:putative ABC transport system permease protein